MVPLNSAGARVGVSGFMDAKVLVCLWFWFGGGCDFVEWLSLRNIRDVQSLAYMLLYVGLIVTQWLWGFSVWQYVALLFFSIGMQVIHHNHIHLGIWRNQNLNRTTSLFIGATTAVPSAMMIGGHVKNHHVHQHGPEDHTSTWKFGGDHNHLAGYLLHPFQAFLTLIPIFWREFRDGLPQRSKFSRHILLEVVLLFAVWLVLALADWRKFLLLVLVPQLFGLHWLLGSNYFQHAHCDDESDANYARNFVGLVNAIWLNIGFHTAHHDHPGAHWSRLKELHEASRDKVDQRLIEKSFFGYVVRTFFLSIFFESCRSRSLRQATSP